MYFRPKIFYPKKSYSMLGEDLVVNNFFKNKTNGFYVDVGCYHPIDGNNTHLLFKNGWSGINIDLNKISIDLFNIARKNDENFRVAVSNKSKKIKFYYRKKINMLNTINKNFANNSFKKGYSIDYIQARTLSSILKESKLKNKKIDFLNIDIEGNEINALKTLNFEIYRPKLICVEIHNFTSNRLKKVNFKDHSIYKFLKQKGYKHIWKNEFSFIFKRK
jgi:FkbM family methyltransferase